jgi:hypothetical protein
MPNECSNLDKKTNLHATRTPLFVPSLLALLDTGQPSGHLYQSKVVQGSGSTTNKLTEEDHVRRTGPIYKKAYNNMFLWILSYMFIIYVININPSRTSAVHMARRCNWYWCSVGEAASLPAAFVPVKTSLTLRTALRKLRNAERRPCQPVSIAIRQQPKLAKLHIRSHLFGILRHRKKPSLKL